MNLSAFQPVPVARSLRLIGFGPCVLVTSGDDERPNAAPIAWTTPVADDPPILAIVVYGKHHTARLIRRTRTFVVNIPEKNLAGALLKCGSASGRTTDKFKASGLTPEKGRTVGTPHLAEASAFIECRLLKAIDMEGDVVFFGKVAGAFARPGFFKDGRVSPRAKTFHHMGGGTFALTGARFAGK